MSARGGAERDPLLYGAAGAEGIVAAEHVEGERGTDAILLFRRAGGKTVQEREPLEPYIVAEAAALSGCPVKFEPRPLEGRGRLGLLALFGSWKDCGKARAWLASATGRAPSDPGAGYLFLSDPVQQHLLRTGKTLFLGMEFEALRRMQVDIECLASPGYEFCNAERPGDRIVAIGMCDGSGWEQALSGAEMGEKEMLERFVAAVRERDPDVLEGHNLFNFDLPYLSARAKRHRVKLALGRDGSAPRSRPSRLTVAERTIAYERFDVFGRHVVDTLFLVHAYDVTHRSLDGLGLKEAARHFGLASDDRVYVDGSRIGEEYARDPGRIMRYVLDDVRETRGLADLLSRSSFLQAQMLPFSYQNACLRGTATKIDALMLREYLRRGRALPKPDEPRAFEGGYTDVFVRGVVENVHHCDVRSLYPSLMLARKLGPASDDLGAFLQLLETLRAFRLEAKARMQAAGSDRERTHCDALQSTFKVLINSFYGYLGFSQARFSDFAAAEQVTRQGRELLKAMIEWLRGRDAAPIEIDTDGIYFVPPPRCLVHGGRGASALERFRGQFAESLPEGMEVEFDGEYRSMYSYKMKNYALLRPDGEMIIKGAALKSRGLEPFQREFLREAVRLKLEGRGEAELAALKGRYSEAIAGRRMPVEQLARTERLQDSPATYAAKVEQGKRPRSAAHELALRSGREYRAGDQLSYYVTGAKAGVAVHLNSKLVSDWNPELRDENVAHYLAKLEALARKFADGGEDGDNGEGTLL